MGFGRFEGTARGFSWYWRVILFVGVVIIGEILVSVGYEWVGGEGERQVGVSWWWEGIVGGNF